jgi:hypothetical protein
MKRIIDISDDTFNILKNMIEADCVDPYSLADIIVNKSIPYEERSNQNDFVSSQTEVVKVGEPLPKAEWLYFEGVSTSGYLECSKCGETDFHKRYSNFCPNCGKYMKHRKGSTENGKS